MIGRKLTSALCGRGLRGDSRHTDAGVLPLFGRCGSPRRRSTRPSLPLMLRQPRRAVRSRRWSTTCRRRRIARSYVNRPVTSYVPQPACDACGRSTTVMRPVTSYVAQPQLVPYTTYRPVVDDRGRPCCGAAPFRRLCSGRPLRPVAARRRLRRFRATPGPWPLLPPAPACCGSDADAVAVELLAGLRRRPRCNRARSCSRAHRSPSPGSTLQSLTPTPDPSLNAVAAPSTTSPARRRAKRLPQTTATARTVQPQSRHAVAALQRFVELAERPRASTPRKATARRRFRCVAAMRCVRLRWSCRSAEVAAAG